MKVMNSRLLSAIVAATALLVVPSGVAAATELPGAQSTQLSAAEVEDLRALFDKFEIPEHQQDGLIEVAEAGQPWDVYEPGAEPVEVEHDRVISGYTYTIERYADGSVAATGLEVPQPAGLIGPMAISQCRWSTGSGYSNATGCQLDGIWGSVLIGAANVSWTHVQGGLDRITSFGYGYQKCFAPTGCSSPVLVMSKTVEGSGNAYARWQSDVSAAWGTWNVWIQLNVGGDRAWQTNS